MRSRAAATVALGLVWAGTATAQEPDKSGYTLFNPTPKNLLRDMTTDRPDLTESPFTVDAGHVQVESTLFGYGRSRADADGTATKSYEYGTTNIRVGLTNSAEFNVVIQPHGVVQTRPVDPIDRTRVSGIGGVDLRMKINLWGNDTFGDPGTTALALLPFLTLPTDRDNGISPDRIEGGLIVPYALKLSEKFGLGINGGFHVVSDGPDGGHHTEWLASAALSYEWSEKFGTYYEVAGRFNTQDPRGEAVVLATGFTYKLADNLQLDGGVNFGVTKAADRINPFLGLSVRF